jgi:hypothetical protein
VVTAQLAGTNSITVIDIRVTLHDITQRITKLTDID